MSERDVDRLVAGLRSERTTDSGGTGTIHGRVVDGDGKGVEGVLMLLERASSRWGTPLRSSHVGRDAPQEQGLEDVVRKAADRYNESRAHRSEARTDANGDYRFEGVGRQQLNVSGYLAEFQIIPDAYAHAVRANAEVDFTATQLIEVAVSVFVPDGTPARGALLHVRLDGERKNEKRYSWSEQEPFLRLIPGDYEVLAYSDGADSLDDAEFAAEPQDVVVEIGMPALRFDLQARLGIRGVVRLAKGDPPADRLVVKLIALGPRQDADPLLLLESDTRDRIFAGQEYSFQDLDPGRYLVGVQRSWNSPILAHRALDVTTGPVQCDMQLPALDRSRYVRLTVLDSQGELMKGVKFMLSVRRPGSSSSGGANAIRERDGTYLLGFEAGNEAAYFGEEGSDAEFELRATHEDHGSKTISLTRGQTEALVSFITPGTLEVTIAGYAGSGYEGRLKIEASKLESGRGFQGSSSSKSAMSQEGVQVIENLEPGRYTVQLELRAKGAGIRMFQGKQIDAVDVEVHAGHNVVQIQIPALHSLRVHWADGKQGSSMHLRSNNSSQRWMRSTSAKLDGTGHAAWEDLPGGEYTLQAMGGQSLQMNVTVPTGVVEFKPVEINALRVHISDPAGDLARLGFQHGDLVIGSDGKEFAANPDLGLLGSLLSSKSAEVNFLVLRGEERLEILVKGSDVGDWQDMGGMMVPAGR